MKHFFAIQLCIFAAASFHLAAEPQIHKMKGNVFTAVRKVDAAAVEKGNALRLDGDKLYYCAGNKLQIFDVSSPLAPEILGQCELKGLCRQVTSKDGIVYVASRETGLWIVDARDPHNPRLLTRYDAVELATGVDVAGDILFIGLRQNGVEFVDVSDPANPQHIFLQKTEESQSVWYNNGIVYSGEWGKSQITVIDAHDMSDIHVLGILPLRGFGDGVYTNGRYLYAATGHNGNDKTKSKAENEGKGHALEVFDISDPASPRMLSRIKFEDCYKRGYNDFWSPRPNGDNKICFVADTFNGLYAVDMRNPENTKVIGRITFSAANGDNTPVSSTAVGNGAVYIASFAEGLFVAECPKAKIQKIDRGVLPVNSSYRYPYATPAESRFTAWKPSGRALVRGVACKDDIVYVACSDAGLAILRQNAAGRLEQIGSGKSTFAGDVKVIGDRLFVAEGLDGLAVYEIRSGKELVEIHRQKDLGYGIDWCLWVWALSEDFLGVSGRFNGNIVLDIKNFPNMVPVFHANGFAGWDKYFPERLCPGNVLAWLSPHKAVNWTRLDVQKPKIDYADRNNVPNLMSNVSNYKDGKIIVCVKRELRILEPGVEYDAAAPGVKGDFVGAPLWDGGNLLSINNRIERQIRLVDVSDDNAPKILFKENLQGNPEIPTFFKGKLLVPCGYQGLLLQK